MQKMREALKRAKKILSGIATLSRDHESRKGAKWLLDEWVAPALFTPPRNCDIGTPEEQEKRFENYTAKHWHLGKTAFQWAPDAIRGRERQ